MSVGLSVDKMHPLCHRMIVEETNQLNESKIISMHYKSDGSVHFEYNTTAIIIQLSFIS